MIRILILLLLISFFGKKGIGQCTHPDYDALMELYNATGGASWTYNTGWGDNSSNCNPCNWFGVRCDVNNNRVTGIDLDGDPDFGNYSSDPGNNLSGAIPNLNFPFLTYLNLNTNQLTGSIPNFSNLPNLSILYLVSNELTGSIPNFSNLPELVELDLNDNQLSASIPNFSNLPNLSSLYLGYNQLTNSIPNLNLPFLTRLELYNNQLSGSIPNFSNLPNLLNLYLEDNQLTGSIPNFSNLPTLSFLDLNNNQLSGPIPDFSNSPNFYTISLSNNQLTGSIPNFSNLLNLNGLYIANNQLSGCYLPFVCPPLNFFDSNNNPLLPWEGDHNNFCLGITQTGAPCDDGNPNTTNDMIQAADCNCQGNVPCNNPTLTISGSVCPGESYSYYSMNYDPGNYIVTVPGPGGCDTTVALNISELQQPTLSISESLCPGESYSYYNEDYDAGIYTLTILGIIGCDTIVTLNLTELPQPTLSISASLCPGESYSYYNEDYDAGIYTVTIPGTVGCDTIVTLNISELPSPAKTIIGEVCLGKQYIFNGQPYYEGTYYINIPGTGCDTILTLIINSIAAPTVYLNESVCPGESYIYYNEDYGPGTYTVTIPGTLGCDTIVTLNITELPQNNGTIQNVFVCPDDLYAFIDNIPYSAGSQAYPIPYPSSFGCDSTVNYYVNEIQPTGTVQATLASLPCGGGVNSTFFLTPFFAFPPVFSGITWYNSAGVEIGSGSSVIVSSPGTYKAIVTTIMDNPSNVTPSQITCTKEFPITITAENSTLVAPVTEGPINLCAGIPYDFNVTNVQVGVLGYAWQYPSGTATGPSDTSKITLSYANAGNYKIFVSAVDVCGPGPQDSFDINVAPALILTPQNVQACNDVLQPLPSMVNLDTLITGNIAYTGTWTLVSGPGTPAGTLPIQDYTGMTSTGVYVYEYTPNQAGVCVVTPIQVQIDLKNCICPPLSIAPNAGTTCNDIGTINLNNTVQGTTGAGTWAVTNEPVGSTVMIAGGIVNFGSQPAGTYDFTYTLTNSMAGCPMTAVTSVTIMAAPVAKLKTVEQACNSNFSPDYVNEVNFDTLVVSGVTGGVWTYTGPGGDPGTASFSPKDFNGATKGTYEYTYTIMGDPSCQPVSYKIDIIVEDCKCPSVAISPEESFCNTVPTINLNDYKVTTKPGSWFIESGPAGSTATITGGNMFVGTGSTYGQYVLYYKLDAAAPIGCFDTAQLILTLDSTAFAGVNDVYDRCADFGSKVDLDTVLSQQQLGGTWLYTGGPNIGSSFNATTGVLDYNSLPEGIGYTFNYTVASPLGLCPATTSTLTLAKNALPVADAGTDGYIDCVIETVSIGGPNTSTGAGINYSWTNTTTSSSVGNTATVSGIVDAGIYELEVTNRLTGCVETDVVEVTKDNAAISGINYEVDSITCYNKADAQISIIDISGGTPTFEYSIDGGSYGSNKDFADLSPGNHTIEVRDDNGCHYSQMILIDNPEEVKVELGTNKVIAEGDVVTISPDISIDLNDANIVWSSDPTGTSCNNCPELTVSPIITTTYFIEVNDKQGCLSKDSIEIGVNSIAGEIIETDVITPNGDGVNDELRFTTSNVISNSELSIYNRWGDRIYHKKDYTNDWDASGYPGGVYYYILKVDGKEVKKTLTVMK